MLRLTRSFATRRFTSPNIASTNKIPNLVARRTKLPTTSMKNPLTSANTTRNILLQPHAFQTRAFSCTSTQMSMFESSLQYEYPEFDKIKFEGYEPAFMKGIEEHLAEVDKIANNPEPATFENTLVALENAGKLIRKVNLVFSNLNGTDTTDEMQDLETKLSPILSKYSDDIYLNSALFNRVKAVHDIKDTLSPLQKRLVEVYYTRFVYRGAALSAEDQEVLRKLNADTSALETKFSQDMVGMLDNEYIVVDTVEELAGLSDSEIASAKALAEKKGETGYVIQLVNTTRHPMLASLKCRATREKLYKKSVSRGQQEGSKHNTGYTYELLKMRAKMAALFGLKNYAELALVDEMYTPEQAGELLGGMVPDVIKNVNLEYQAIQEVAKRDNITTVEAHDWEYYSEIVRTEQYSLDQNLIKPYFELQNVIENCVFYVCNVLYGIRFEKRTDLPLYHEDCVTYNIFDMNNEQIGIFITDYFKRGSKSGGAWMTSFGDGTPVILNVLNIPKPANPNEPCYLTIDEITTLLHEMGHGLHGLSQGKIPYRTLEGTNTSTDFVELPSTVHEDFALHKQVLANYAKNAQGEAMPQELIQKIIDTKTFNQGFDTLEYLSAALVDLEVHRMTVQDFEEFDQRTANMTNTERMVLLEKQIREKYGISLDYVPSRYGLLYFSHSMTSYASKYYAYLASEVLAADAHKYIVEQGFTREIGLRFKKEVLDTGNTRDHMESCVAFRGQKPTSEGLLIRRGIIKK